jgi:peptidoglycan/xylan/chitin deacetylase (PgdA/CDA1 family)
MLLARLFAIAAFFFAAMAAEAREIAITFDDAPIPDSPLSTGEARTEKLIAALQAAGIAEVAFFATPKDFTATDKARLVAYANAGHIIANHSRRHRNLRQMTAADYVADIADADRLLRDLPNFRPWFRFPFLSEGDTVEKRDEVRKSLRSMGYAQGYVTVDNYDWYLNKLANDAKRDSKPVDQSALRDLYVETIVKAVEFYDRIAVNTLGRSPKHVLLLHENDMAAMFIGDLASALRAKGWTIISPEEAYKDPIAAIEPDTLFLGQGRVAALAEAQGAKRSNLVHEREDEAILDMHFEDRVLKK